MKLITDSIRLADSIVYKSKLYAIGDLKSLMDRGLYSDDIYDSTKWHYYLNICGEYNPLNERMYVLDNVLLDKDTLLSNDRLKALFYHDSEMFRDLLYRYPNNVGLIYGLLNVGKFTIEELIDKRDGEIINYNQELVEWNEYSLISTLQESLYEFLQRYTNPEFLIADRDYYHGLSLAIQSFLINKIIEIRIGKQNTNEAHSFFQIAKLNSNLYIGSLVEYLKKEQLLWLYRNIDDISFNVGKHENLLYIVERLIKPSGYNVDYILSNNTNIVEYESDGRRVGDKLTNPLLLVDILDPAKKNNIDIEQIYKLMEQRYNRGIDINTLNRDKSKALLTNDFEERTKYLHLSKGTANLPNMVHSSDILIPITASILKENSNKTYTIVIDSLNYRLLGGDILTLYLYAIYNILGRNLSTLDKIVNNILIDIENVTNEELLDNIDFTDVADADLFSDIINSVRINTIPLDHDNVVEYMNNQLYLINYLHLMTSSINNVVFKGMWSNIVGRIMKGSVENIELTNLANDINSVSLDLSSIDTKEKWFGILNDIVTMVTGETLMKEEEERHLLRLQAEMLNRLTSYTVTTIYKDPVEAYSVKFDNISGAYDTTIIDIKEIDYSCLGSGSNISYAFGSDAILGVSTTNTPSVDVEVTDDIAVVSAKYLEDGKIYIDTTLPVYVNVY